MNEFWAFMIGADRLREGRVEDWNIFWKLQAKPGWFILLFFLAALASYCAVWWFYKREPAYCKKPRRIVMTVFRVLGLTVLWIILAGPTLALEMTGTVRGQVAVLLDASASMSRRDRYAADADDPHRARAAAVLGAVKPGQTDLKNLSEAVLGEVDAANREELVRAMFLGANVDLWNALRRNYDVDVRAFSRGDELQILGADTAADPAAEADGKKKERRRDPKEIFDAYKAVGESTEIGNALKNVVRRLKGRPLAGVVLVSDGNNNRGLDPLMVAKELGVPVVPIGVGIPRPRDTALVSAVMERRIFVKDDAPLTVRLRQYGCAKETVSVNVTAAGKEVAAQRAIVLAEEETVVTLRVKFDKPGKYALRIESPPLPDDAEPANNVIEREVEVMDKKLRVLVVEAEPQWEYRYLKSSLLRDDRVEAKVLFFGIDRKKLAEIDEGGYIAEFPKDKKELFQYDVIVFGNVPRDRFTDEDLDRLRSFVVEEGGGLWMISGKNNFPNGYLKSKFEQLFPVELERMPEVTLEDERLNPLKDPFRVKLTAEGRLHGLMRLDPESGPQNEAGNAKLWAQMPEMYWRQRVKKAKPNATVLLTYDGPDDLERRRRNEPPEPLLATARVGRGLVLFSAVRDLFRMRFPAELGPKALERFHAHAVQYLGLPHLLGENRRVEIHTDRPEYSVGDEVRVYARVLERQTYEPLVVSRLNAVSTAKDGRGAVTFQLEPTPGEPGYYHSRDFKAKAEGEYRVHLPEEDDGGAYADYVVRSTKIELEEPGMNRELLEAVARAANPGNPAARMFFPDEARGVLDVLRASEEALRTRFEDPLWDSPLMLLAFTLFFGLEWLIRKRSDLC